ncbi:MAG: elongation factor 1-beta, partial [Candidatus Helarchaeota archaeon]
MAKRILAIMKVLPESTDIDHEILKKEIKKVIPEGFELEEASFKKEYIAFGLESLNFRLFCPNEDGITDKIEEILGN